MANKKKEEIENQILRQLEGQEKIGLADVAEAVGLKKDSAADRRAIARAFKNLVDQGLIEAKGAARARVYVRKGHGEVLSPVEKPKAADAFEGVQLSKKSKEVIAHVSQSLSIRKHVGYNQDFLRNYRPNQDFYFSKEQLEQLKKIGLVDQQTKPAGTYARTILNRLLIDLSWNSSRLEGNTYSLLETKRLIELGESAAGKDATETQMILNHKSAIEFIMDSAESNVISSQDVRNIHALLSDNLLGDPSASGRIRQIIVGIGGTNYMPLENPHVIQECFDVFIEKLNQIEEPFEQSIFSIVHLSYLQAFEDVNKRTSRLVANIPLVKKNFKPLSFIDVNQEAYVKSLLGVYEINDTSLICDLYLWAYKRSADKYSAIQQALGEPNLLKMKYRTLIHDTINQLIVEKTAGADIVVKILRLLDERHLPEEDSRELFKLIETEIASLHDGNIARYKIRPSQYQEWKILQ